MTRHTWIVWMSGGVLGYVAGEMLVEEPALQPGLGELGVARWLVPIFVAVAITTLGWLAARAKLSVRTRRPQ